MADSNNIQQPFISAQGADHDHNGRSMSEFLSSAPLAAGLVRLRHMLELSGINEKSRHLQDWRYLRRDHEADAAEGSYSLHYDVPASTSSFIAQAVIPGGSLEDVMYSTVATREVDEDHVHTGKNTASSDVATAGAAGCASHGSPAAHAGYAAHALSSAVCANSSCLTAASRMHSSAGAVVPGQECNSEERPEGRMLRAASREYINPVQASSGSRRRLKETADFFKNLPPFHSLRPDGFITRQAASSLSESHTAVTACHEGDAGAAYGAAGACVSGGAAGAANAPGATRAHQVCVRVNSPSSSSFEHSAGLHQKLAAADFSGSEHDASQDGADEYYSNLSVRLASELRGIDAARATFCGGAMPSPWYHSDTLTGDSSSSRGSHDGHDYAASVRAAAVVTSFDRGLASHRDAHIQLSEQHERIVMESMSMPYSEPFARDDVRSYGSLSDCDDSPGAAGSDDGLRSLMRHILAVSADDAKQNTSADNERSSLAAEHCVMESICDVEEVCAVDARTVDSVLDHTDCSEAGSVYTSSDSAMALSHTDELSSHDTGSVNGVQVHTVKSADSESELVSASVVRSGGSTATSLLGSAYGCRKKKAARDAEASTSASASAAAGTDGAAGSAGKSVHSSGTESTLNAEVMNNSHNSFGAVESIADNDSRAATVTDADSSGAVTAGERSGDITANADSQKTGSRRKRLLRAFWKSGRKNSAAGGVTDNTLSATDNYAGSQSICAHDAGAVAGAQAVAGTRTVAGAAVAVADAAAVTAEHDLMAGQHDSLSPCHTPQCGGSQGNASTAVDSSDNVLTLSGRAAHGSALSSLLGFAAMDSLSRDRMLNSDVLSLTTALTRGPDESAPLGCSSRTIASSESVYTSGAHVHIQSQGRNGAGHGAMKNSVKAPSAHMRALSRVRRALTRNR